MKTEFSSQFEHLVYRAARKGYRFFVEDDLFARRAAYAAVNFGQRRQAHIVADAVL